MYDYGGPPPKWPFLKVPAFRWGLLAATVPMVLMSVISVAFKMPGSLLLGGIYWVMVIAAASVISATGHRQAAAGLGAGFLIGSLALGASFLVVAGAFG